jgi:hypothetical protein
MAVKESAAVDATQLAALNSAKRNLLRFASDAMAGPLLYRNTAINHNVDLNKNTTGLSSNKLATKWTHSYAKFYPKFK